MQHGQFLPFNDLQEGVFSKKNPTNLTDLYGHVLSSLDPRKGEKLYGIPASSYNDLDNGKTKPGEVDYFEIPGLMAGTPFLVEERSNEIPAGYTLLGYNLTEGPYSDDNQGEGTNHGVIKAELSSQTVTIHNRHGYGLIAEKVWSDADFMDSHDPVYLAVYLDGSEEPLEGTVRKLVHPDTTVRWFFPELAQGKTLNDYKVYEVLLTGKEKIDPVTGAVTGYDSIERKMEGDLIQIAGTSSEHGYSSNITYTVGYSRDLIKDEQLEKVHFRKDTVKNSRPGIRFVKTDINGNPLAGAKFSLSEIGNKTKTFVSDDQGLIAVAYLKEGKEYTLEETAAPFGYLSLIDKLKIKVQFSKNEAGEDILIVYVNDSRYDHEDGYYKIDQVNVPPTVTNMPTVTIKNRDNILKAVKIDSSTGNPMKGLVFSLYREAKESNSGNPMRDYEPMEGYESLVTNEEGIIPKIVLKNSDNPDGLEPGNYYLHEDEESTPSAYKPMGIDIRIMIAPTGQVTLQRAERPVQSGSWKLGELSEEIASVSSENSGTVTINVKNTPKEPVRIMKMEEGSTKTLSGVGFKLFRQNQIGEDGLPAANQNPCIEGVTDEHGIMNLGGLEDGINYFLFETSTLDGYVLLDGPVMIHSTVTNNETRIKASHNGSNLECKKVKDENGKDVWQFIVYNSYGYELPETGGSGTGLIYITGIILALGAGFLLLRRNMATKR